MLHGEKEQMQSLKEDKVLRKMFVKCTEVQVRRNTGILTNGYSIDRCLSRFSLADEAE